MRAVLRLLGSRYGIALLLLVVILAVVGITRALHGGRDMVTADSAPTTAVRATINPSAGNDGANGVDGVVGGPPAASGSATTPAGPDPTPAAVGFTRAWLAHTGVTAAQWYAGIAPYMTTTLAAKLKNTDPSGVPADRMTGAVSIGTRTADYAEASVPVDSGTLRLRLRLSAGRWLVDGVDWDRA